ncbi:MAG TPA: hypothetical protein VF424_01470 [Vicinamibacterales bacterium]
MSALVVSTTLAIVGFVLLAVGVTIQFRHRSPYTGATMDQEARKRFGRGAWIAAAGGFSMLLAQFARYWR